MTKKLISWDDVALALPAVVMTKLLATFDALGAAAAVTPASIGAATPASVTAAVAALVNAAPGTMDTLGEIATVIASDESAAAALLTSVATKATIASLTAETSRATAAEGANAAAIAKAVPRWAATTAYTAGDQVVSPNNDVVKRTTTGTSGATYDPTQWQVSATFARRDLSTLVVIGDSLTEQGGLRPTTLNQTTGYSFWPWALSLTGKRLRLLSNAGVGGQTSGSMLARFQTDVIALAPGWCHILAGTNDVLQDVPLATTQANLLAMFDACDAASIRVIAGTIPPNNGWTTPRRAVAAALNAWLKALGRSRRNLTVADYFAAVTDPVTGGYLAGMNNADGTHLESKGGYACGRVLAGILTTLVPPADLLLTDPLDPTNLLGVDGRFPGAAAGVPTNWLVQSYTVAPTYSQVARTGLVAGNWKSLVVPNGDKCSIAHNVNVGASMAVGDSVFASVEYDISNLDQAAAVNTQAFYLQLQSYNGATFTNLINDLYWDTGKVNHPAASRAGVLSTPSFVIPAGTTLMQAVIYCRGGGTYLLDRADIRKG